MALTATSTKDQQSEDRPTVSSPSPGQDFAAKL
jgi:hypothetical protein